MTAAAQAEGPSPACWQTSLVWPGMSKNKDLLAEDQVHRAAFVECSVRALEAQSNIRKKLTAKKLVKRGL